MDQFAFRSAAPAPDDDSTDLVQLAERQMQPLDTSRTRDPISDMTYDETVEIAQMMAPTPGIEGTDIGSGA